MFDYNNLQFHLQTTVCDLIIQVAPDEPDIGLLVVNILNKDLTDPNPRVRSVSVTSICSIPGLVSHVDTAVRTGLQDSNTAVRVSAVTGVGRVWRHSPDQCRDLGLVELLYKMLRDQDSTVVSFTLQTLNVILEADGGVQLNKKMTRFLLTRVVNYREKEFCFVVDHLAASETDDELRLEILNTLDSSLDHSDGNVMLSVAKLFIRLVRTEPSLKTSLVKRLVPVFTSYFSKSGSNKEFNQSLLDHIQSLDPDYITALRPQYKVFFPKQRDPLKLKQGKIKFLSKLVTEDNAMEILNFLLNFLPHAEELSRDIFTSVSCVCESESSCFTFSVRNLEMLLKTDCDKYLPNILLTARLFKLETSDEDGQSVVRQFVQTLIKNVSIRTISHDHDQLSALLHLLHHHCQDIPESPLLIEEIQEIDKSDWTPHLFTQLLSTSYQVFLSQPAAMQTILGKDSILLTLCVPKSTLVSKWVSQSVTVVKICCCSTSHHLAII